MKKPVAHRLLLGGSLSLLLAACGQPQMSSPAELDPYAGGAQHPWSYVAPPGQLAPSA